MRTIRRNVVVITGLLVASIALSGTAHAGVVQPDSGVMKGRYSDDVTDYTGYGEYGGLKDQTVRSRVRAGRSKIFSFLAYNAGSSADAMSIVGCASDGPVKIKWLDLSARPTLAPSGRAAVVIQPNSGFAYSMRATVNRRFEGRGVFKCLFEVTSGNDSSVSDRSLATFKVIG